MNHSTITVKGSLPSIEKIHKILEEIVSARWKKSAVILTGENITVKCDASEEYHYSLQIWKDSRRTIHIRRGSRNDLMHWIESFVQNELAARLDGMCGNEGVPEKWNPEPGKFSTFESYFNMMDDGLAFPLKYLRKRYFRSICDETPDHILLDQIKTMSKTEYTIESRLDGVHVCWFQQNQDFSKRRSRHLEL